MSLSKLSPIIQHLVWSQYTKGDVYTNANITTTTFPVLSYRCTQNWNEAFCPWKWKCTYPKYMTKGQQSISSMLTNTWKNTSLILLNIASLLSECFWPTNINLCNLCRASQHYPSYLFIHGRITSLVSNPNMAKTTNDWNIRIKNYHI